MFSYCQLSPNSNRLLILMHSVTLIFSVMLYPNSQMCKLLRGTGKTSSQFYTSTDLYLLYQVVFLSLVGSLPEQVVD